jgi:Uncharacterised protein family (UPF0175)
MMQITLNIPEEVGRNLGDDTASIERAALEALALEGIRSGALSRGQVRKLLGFRTRYDVDGFLKTHGVPVQERPEEVRRDSGLVLSLGRK